MPMLREREGLGLPAYGFLDPNPCPGRLTAHRSFFAGLCQGDVGQGRHWIAPRTQRAFFVAREALYVQVEPNVDDGNARTPQKYSRKDHRAMAAILVQ